MIAFTGTLYTDTCEFAFSALTPTAVKDMIMLILDIL